MPTVDKIVEDLHATSDKLSEVTRTISLSVLALVWLFIAGGDESPTLPNSPNQTLLFVAGLLVLLSLLADYLQSVVGYQSSKDTLALAESSKERSAQYDPKSTLYRLRIAFFWMKQALALSALVVLFLAVILAFVC